MGGGASTCYVEDRVAIGGDPLYSHVWTLVSRAESFWTTRGPVNIDSARAAQAEQERYS